MPRSLPADCLNEVFENLDDDKTLHSCLLVNRLWCKISVRILWRNIWSFIHSRNLKVASSILCTLISCLPNESKEILHKNEIFISIPTSKPPLFDYAAFCKVLSVDKISQMIYTVLKRDTSISSKNLKEILKMFMNRISSLKTLYHSRDHKIDIQYNIPFTSFPGARDYLEDLSELHCSSDIHSEFFYQLSRICHNLRSLNIEFKREVSNSLKELISSQNNLKNLKLSAYERNIWADIIPALTRHSNTLAKLQLYGCGIDRLQFVSSFLNLQEIEFSFIDGNNGIQFEDLQYVTFSKLGTLKIPCQFPKLEYLMKFLEINGRSLKECYIFNSALNSSSIVKFCPNLKKLFVTFGSDELKTIFNSCQDLEGIVIQSCLNEKEVLETVAKHSSKNFNELKLHNPKLIPENLESFFINWNNRTSKKSLSLTIVKGFCKYEVKKENMEIIEKYKNLGVIKNFENRVYCDGELYL